MQDQENKKSLERHRYGTVEEKHLGSGKDTNAAMAPYSIVVGVWGSQGTPYKRGNGPQLVNWPKR
jgi:hypothetical protein